MTDPIGTAQERELIEELRTSASLFREHPVYDSEGDGVLLTRNADLDEQAADALQSRIAEVGRLTEALEKIADRCWQTDETNWKHDILSIIVPIMDAKIDERRATLSLQTGDS